MNLKTKAFGLIAVLAMCLGLTGQALADDVNSANTDLTVSTTDVGVFAIGFSATSNNFTPVNTDLVNAISTGTSIALVFTDTKTYRSEFQVRIQASNMVSDKQVPYQAAGTFYQIPASNLTIVNNYNPMQTRWTGQGGYLYRVGDPGAVDDTGTVDGSLPNFTPLPWTVNNTLDQPRYVTHAWAGSGTLSTTQPLDLGLLVPPAMPGATYTSTLTASVTFQTP